MVFSPIDKNLERNYQWKMFTSKLYSDLTDALARGEELDADDLIRQVEEEWNKWIDDKTYDEYDNQSEKLKKQFDKVYCTIWCAGQAATTEAKRNVSEIDLALDALENKPKYIEDNEAWARGCIHSMQDLNPHDSLTIPIALVGVLGSEKGSLATLEMEVLKPGAGAVYRHPADTFNLDPSYRFIALHSDFEASIEAAWEAARNLAGEAGKLCDGRWRLQLTVEDKPVSEPQTLYEGQPMESWQRSDDEEQSVEGRSASGAAALGWYHALKGTTPDEGVIVLSELNFNGELSEVDGVSAKTKAIASATNDDSFPRFDTVVVASADNQREAVDALRFLGKLGPIRVVMPATLEKLVTVRAQFVEEVINYQREVRRQLGELPHFYPSHLEFDQIRIRVKVRQERRRVDDALEQELETRRLLQDFDHLDFEDPQNPYQSRSLSLDPEDEKQKTVEFVNWETVREGLRRCVILGDPGFGKTFLLHAEGRRIARESEQRLGKWEIMPSDEKLIIPIFQRLVDVAKEDGEIEDAVLSLLKRDYRFESNPLSETFWTFLVEKLKAGHCCLLLDGLDEVTEERRQDLRSRLERFVKKYPHCQIYVASRIVGYGASPFHLANTQKERELELVGFERKQQRQFVEMWFADNRALARDLLNELRKAPMVRGLAQVPLMLSLICWLYDEERTLPVHRIQLYEKCVRRLFSRAWKEHPRDPTDPDLDAMVELAEEIAFSMFTRDMTLFTMRELRECVGRILDNLHDSHDFKDRRPNELIRQLSEEDGILVKVGEGDNPPYMFLHLTFQEYMTALVLSRQPDWLSDAKRHFWLPKWTEPLTLLAGIVETPVTLLEAILVEEEELFSSMLLLAGRCVSGAVGNRHRNLQRPPPHALRSVEDEIIQRLVTTRLEDRPHIDHAALEYVLAQIGDKAAEMLIQARRQIRWENEGTEEQALTQKVIIRSLGVIGRVEDVELLIGVSQREDGLRYPAIEALGKLGDDERVVSALLDLLPHEDELIRRLAAQALGQIGFDDERVIEALREGLRDSDGSARSKSAEALGKIGSDNDHLIDELLLALEEPNRDVRAAAVAVLDELGSKKAIEPLISLLREEEEWDIRWSAIRALGKIGLGDERVTLALLSVLKADAHKSVRYFAVKVLGELGNERAIGPLISVLFHEDDRAVRDAVVTALGHFDNALVSSFLRFAFYNVELRLNAPQALARQEGLASIERLETALQSGNQAFRKAAVEALSEIDSEQAIALLIEASQNPLYIQVRRTAIKALSKRGDERAIEPLIQAFLDENPLIREPAIEALGEVGDERAIEPIFSLLRELETEVRNHGRDVRMARVPPSGELEASRNEEMIKAGFTALRKIGLRHQLRIFPDGRMERRSPAVPSPNPSVHPNWVSRLRNLLR